MTRSAANASPGRGAIARLRGRLPNFSSFDRAIALAAAALIACVWVLTVERVGSEQSRVAAGAVLQATNLAVAAEQHALSTLEDVEQTLTLIIREYERRGTQPSLQELFDNGATAAGLYDRFLIADERGDVVSSSASTAGFNVADRDYFRHHEQQVDAGIFIGRPVQSRATGKWIIPVARRIGKPDGSFGGVVTAAIDPAFFTDFYRRIDVGSKGVVALVGLDGIARARRSGDQVDYGKDYRDTSVYRRLSSWPTGSLLGEGRLDGVRRYISYRTLSSYALFMEVGLAEADVLGEFNDRKATYYLAASAASIVLVLMAAGLLAAARRQRLAHDELLRNEARFRATFDQASVGILHVDLDGRFLRANGRFCEMHGYAESEIRDLTIADITHPDERANMDRFRRALLENLLPSRASPVEKRNVRKDGSTIWVSIAVALVRDAEGRPDYFATMVYDVSERKQAEQAATQSYAELAQLNARLQDAQAQLFQSEKMASIGQLAAGVAHEINNPIGYVHSNLGSLSHYIDGMFSVLDCYEEALARIDDPQLRAELAQARVAADLDFLRGDVRALMDESKEGIGRVKKIVQDLKNFSHSTEDDDWQYADLHHGLDSTIGIVWNELKYKATLDKRYGALPPVQCLPSELNQVFMNLLVNGAQAIREQGTITLRTGTVGDEVFVEFTDTGEGIAPEHLKRIFDPFFTTKPVGKGTGLGLSISYRIAAKHHGRIEVASEVGRGTTFTVWLPVAQPPPAAQAAGPASALAAESAELVS